MADLALTVVGSAIGWMDFIFSPADGVGEWILPSNEFRMNRQSLTGIAALVFISLIALAIIGDLVFGFLGLFG